MVHYPCRNVGLPECKWFNIQFASYLKLFRSKKSQFYPFIQKTSRFNHTPPKNKHGTLNNFNPLEKEKHFVITNFLGFEPFVFGCFSHSPTVAPNRCTASGECSTRSAGNCDWSLLKPRWQDRFLGKKRGVFAGGDFKYF